MFIARFFFTSKYPPKWCTYSAGMAGATCNCCRLSAFCVHRTTMHHVTSCKAAYVMSMRVLSLVVFFFFFLRITAVTRGWNGYRNKSQHRKVTLEKRTLSPLLQGFEPATFQSRVRRANHRAIRASKRTFGEEEKNCMHPARKMLAEELL